MFPLIFIQHAGIRNYRRQPSHCFTTPQTFPFPHFDSVILKRKVEKTFSIRIFFLFFNFNFFFLYRHIRVRISLFRRGERSLSDFKNLITKKKVKKSPSIKKNVCFILSLIRLLIVMATITFFFFVANKR
jgi:hypothetical protein